MFIDTDLVAAPATPLVLTILLDGESHGYAILKRLREASDADVEWADGMLYPLLHRLHRLGYVTADWRPESEGRRRRYYAITPAGRGARAGRQRHGRTAAGPSNGVWSRLLLAPPGPPAGIRRPPRPAFCPQPLLVAGNSRGTRR